MREYRFRHQPDYPSLSERVPDSLEDRLARFRCDLDECIVLDSFCVDDLCLRRYDEFAP